MGFDAAAESERRGRLLGVKLKALVADHLGAPVEASPQSFPDGAALVLDDRAWVLVENDASEALGRALAWSLRRGVAGVSIVAEEGSGVLARRAAGFDIPIDVWFPIDRTLVPAVPDPLAAPPPAAPEHLQLTRLIEAGGAEPTVEHGVVTGEVRGLEVCRVVDRPTTGTFAELGDVVTPSADGLASRDDPGVRLEVGVGAADREAFQLLHGDVPTIEALSQVVRAVGDHRRADAPQHPLNRLVRERFLRWRAVGDPALVGMTAVAPAEPPVPRRNLKDVVPCVATATTPAGEPATVVFSSGVDLGLLPFVVDVQAVTEAPVLVALPARDRVGLTLELGERLRRPVEIRSIDT